MPPSEITDATAISAARDDFRRARRAGALQDLMARLTGHSAALLSFEDVRRKLRTTAIADRGLQEIPLAAIVGTTGRYTDFTRDFLPRQSVDEIRWARVRVVAENPQAGGLPPIEVYQIGAAYFVRDGHHRVSVARQQNWTHIPAYVTEVRTKVPLAADASPDDVIRQAEYADFLETTHFDALCPGAQLQVSELGQYQRLLDHIEVHRFFMETEHGQPVPDDEVIPNWYHQTYSPLVSVIRERGLLRDFPGRTETDLYLWATEHAAELREALGWPVEAEAVVEKLAAAFSPAPNRQRQRMLEWVIPAPLADGPTPGTWRRERLEARYLNRLFPDILVPLNSEPASWTALEQAIVVAQREGGRLFGLHVVSEATACDDEAAHALREAFQHRCAAAGLTGTLAIEAGDIAGRICERAALVDLVVVRLAHPPSAQPLERLSSGFRTLIRRCPRPVLAVPRAATPLRRLLLAFDNSPKAKEALFVAAYLAGDPGTRLTVINVTENAGAADPLAFARQYLEFHEVAADFQTAGGPVPAAIRRAAGELESDLILMGGYGAQPVVEVLLGSSVDQVLRTAPVPLLLCR